MSQRRPQFYRRLRFSSLIFGLASLMGIAACRTAATRSQDEIEAIEVVRGPFDRTGTQRRQALVDSALLARTRWQLSRPSSYELRVVERSACFSVHPGDSEPPARPVYLISPDSIRHLRLEPIPDSLARACWHAWSVDDLFNRLFEALNDVGTAVSSVMYDGIYGFPRMYILGDRGHGPSRIVVDHFKPHPD